MKSKQEVIKSAWLEFMTESDYKNLKIDDNGFCNYQCRRYINSSRWDELYSRIKSGGKTGRDIIYRPKSLSGIENNNGWTGIESEEDLLNIIDKHEHVFLMGLDGKVDIGFTIVLNDKVSRKYWMEHATHYMPIILPEKPIY